MQRLGLAPFLLAVLILAAVLAPLNIFVSPYANSLLIFPPVVAFLYSRGRGVFSMWDALRWGILALTVYLIVFAAFFTTAVYQSASSELSYMGVHLVATPGGRSPSGDYTVRVWSDSGSLRSVDVSIMYLNESELAHGSAAGDNATIQFHGIGEGIYFIRASAIYENGTVVNMPDKLGPVNMGKGHFLALTALAMIFKVYVVGLGFFLGFAYAIKIVRKGKRILSESGQDRVGPLQ